MASLKYGKTASLQTVTLGSSYTSGSGTMSLTSGHGARLPSAGDFWLAYDNGAGTVRIFKVTARSTDTLTVTAESSEGSGDGNISSGETLRWALTCGALDQLKLDSGAMRLLDSQTASSSAQLDFNGIITSTYDSYLIKFDGLTPATSGDRFYLRVSTDGGSTFVTTNTYTWGGTRSNSGGVVADGVAATSAIGLGGNQDNTTSTPGFSGHLYIENGGSGSKKVTFVGHTFTYDGGMNSNSFAGFWDSTTAIDSFRIFNGAGNFSGTIRCYGIVK